MTDREPGIERYERAVREAEEDARSATPDRGAAEIMGYAMAMNRWVPGANPRAADEGWKVVLALATEDAAVAIAALRKAGYDLVRPITKAEMEAYIGTAWPDEEGHGTGPK